MIELSPYSWAAIAIIVVALGVAVSRKFLASGCLIIANGLVFILTMVSPQTNTYPTWHGNVASPGGFGYAIHNDLSLWSTNLLHGDPVGALQLVTNLFVHHDFLHILGNLIVLWAFGLPFEERIGHRRFLAIYLLGGLVGSVAQAYGAPEGQLMGASGAIFAIMGAFATKYPQQVVRVPVPLPIMFFIPMPVVVGVLIYLGYNLVYLFFLGGDTSGAHVGYYAHLAGLAAGAVLALILLRRGATQKEGRVAVDLPKLVPFARDDATQKVLAHMQTNHDEPEVFQAWLDRFFRTATCPTCSHRVLPANRGRVVCTNGHSFDVRQAAAAKAVVGKP